MKQIPMLFFAAAAKAKTQQPNVPQFVKALKDVLHDVATWALFVAPALVAISLLWAGIQISKAEDGVELKEAKSRAARAIVGIAIAGSAIWLGDYLAGKFITTQ